MKSREPAALLVSAGLAAVVWAASVPLSGSLEPWDAESPYYLLALALGGAISGLVVPRALWGHYAGAFAGQALYALFFLPLGPLFVLGLAYLAGYSIVFFAAALLAGSLRRKRGEESATGG